MRNVSMLYHFSEEPDIERFFPRLQKAYPHLKPVVFAINEEQALHYCFPRDCPRVIYWKAEWSSEEDIQHYFAETSVDKIIVVENDWLDRIRQTPLYRYTFAEDSFELFDEASTAGYYISYAEAEPVKVERVYDLIGQIVKQRVELRFTPNLHPIRNRIIASTLDFSIIRFRNAKPLNIGGVYDGIN
ncbi:DUF6886 family protein [Bacillus sp. FJAT-26390]|uniref:DUF6886 family protein n=1 Tax=Bacillus sp. FJAT-26390 TaxID=1743142 RepID=UPI0021002084|nr:DUF6886 family protein [Bacillus sp. FJAT-26390]